MPMWQADDRWGFTLVELLMYVVVSSAAVTAILTLLMSQAKHYRKQVEVADVAETLRGAIGVLVWDLKQVSPTRGDISVIDPQVLVLRSVKGVGDICSVHVDKEKYGIWEPKGRFAKIDRDSALVYNGADGWVAVQLKNVWHDPVAAGVPLCDWGSSSVPDLVVEVSKVGLGAGHTGATIRMFQQVQYGMYEWDDKWWLGLRVSGHGYEVLTGPLRPPTEGGLEFRYFDETGAPTTDRAAVTRVDIVLRALSQGALDTHADSVSTTVFLRD